MLVTSVLPSTDSADALTGRRIVTEVPGPKSLALHERRLRAIPVGVSSALPVYIRRAHGAVLAHPRDRHGGVQPSGERDADAAADGQVREDLRHASRR